MDSIFGLEFQVKGHVHSNQHQSFNIMKYLSAAAESKPCTW